MRNKILIYLVVSVVVTGLTPSITSAASIVGWGSQVVGVDLSKGFVKVAASASGFVLSWT
jgi:hypothetical protein